jgi:hypothetical protein
MASSDGPPAGAALGSGLAEGAGFGAGFAGGCQRRKTWAGGGICDGGCDEAEATGNALTATEGGPSSGSCTGAGADAAGETTGSMTGR